MKPRRRLRNGHAGGWLRDALLEALEYRWVDQHDWWNYIEIDFESAREQRWWYTSSPKRRAQWLLGQLWHCIDIVPTDVRRDFADAEDEWKFATYRDLARHLAQDLKEIPASGPIQLTQEQEEDLAERKKWENLRKQAQAAEARNCTRKLV